MLANKEMVLVVFQVFEASPSVLFVLARCCCFFSGWPWPDPLDLMILKIVFHGPGSSEDLD